MAGYYIASIAAPTVPLTKTYPPNWFGSRAEAERAVPYLAHLEGVYVHELVVRPYPTREVRDAR